MTHRILDIFMEIGQLAMFPGMKKIFEVVFFYSVEAIPLCHRRLNMSLCCDSLLWQTCSYLVTRASPRVVSNNYFPKADDLLFKPQLLLTTDDMPDFLAKFVRVEFETNLFFYYYRRYWLNS